METVTDSTIGRRLRAIRESRGLSQREVAERIGLPRSAVTQIELGNRSVSGPELKRLAALFGCSVDELLAPSPPPAGAGADLVARAAPLVGGSERVLDPLRRFVARARLVGELELALGVRRNGEARAAYELPPPRSGWEAMQQGLRVAADERRRLDLGEAPLRDVAETLDLVGVRVGRLALPEGVALLFLRDEDGSSLVAVNGAYPLSRRRHLYAHGLAHALLDGDAAARVCDLDGRDAPVEVRANAFAAGFLVPEGGLRRFLGALGKAPGVRAPGELFDVFADPGNGPSSRAPVRVEPKPPAGARSINWSDVVLLAAHFGVSRSLVLHRLRNLRLVGAARYADLAEREDSDERDRARSALERGGVDDAVERDAVSLRLLALALEAYRRGVWTRPRLDALAREMGIAEAEMELLVHGLAE